MIDLESFQEIVLTCQKSSIGKLLPNALYVHITALEKINPLIQNYEKKAEKIIGKKYDVTLIKFNLERPRISYLFYPDFDVHPHPELKRSIVVDLLTQTISDRYYIDSNNPPILHRKETFITVDYPHYQKFSFLTNLEVALGLLDNSHLIGTRQPWEKRLIEQRINFHGHNLICPLPIINNQTEIVIERHRAAIVRKELSRPVRIAFEAGLFREKITFFDYGCGYGADVKCIEEKGYQSSGWDPYYCPDLPIVKADIVNLGYVINVIEDPQERRSALIKAWELTEQILIVSAQVLIDDRNRGIVAYGDGIVTSRNTFQKYYQQEELKIYIDQVLNVDTIAIGLGVYVVFRDENEAEMFRAARFHSHLSTPRIKNTTKSFADYQELLQPIMEFLANRGRLPVKGELKEEEEIKKEFPSFRHAYQLILQATDPEEWAAITEKRRQDLQLYLALASFTHRPTVRQLLPVVKEDIKALFGSYKNACILADRMLYSLGNLSQIKNIIKHTKIGKKTNSCLIIHISALEALDPLLRLYEGSARHTVGRLEDSNIIKLNFNQPKVTYLYYPDFEDNPHPILSTKMEIDLQDLKVKYADYNEDDNPPILHEKNTLVTPDYPGYEKFTKLTKQEKNWGLLENWQAINRLKGWQECLEEHCAIIKGHQLFWRPDANPYKIKFLKAEINNRKNKNKEENHSNNK